MATARQTRSGPSSTASAPSSAVWDALTPASTSRCADCPLRRNVPLYRQELQRHKEERQLIDTLRGTSLPHELVLRILAGVAARLLPELHLTEPDTLPSLGRRLLGADTGHLPSMLGDVILETVPISLDLVFGRLAGATATVATLPPFAEAYASEIRTLVVHLKVATYHQYPTTLYRLTAALPSLKTNFSRLHLLHLCVRVRGQSPGPTTLEQRCAEGYTGTITYRTALERLVLAVQAVRPGKRQVLELRFAREGRVEAGGGEIGIDERGAGEIVGRAAGGGG
ncbi:hypothetical protein B0A55_02950 [Friedmanniomyces simplex]|uniref:Uncharacterized protein n=1 Tax=Friedmanniomyces simplex TaxID=329884 RepID=A0A4U0XYW7_9PEZI|nr:hypothetical protein B0A55_02950 [Friedmanniomyces simplex]